MFFCCFKELFSFSFSSFFAGALLTGNMAFGYGFDIVASGDHVPVVCRGSLAMANGQCFRVHGLKSFWQLLMHEADSALPKHMIALRLLPKLFFCHNRIQFLQEANFGALT